jgi:hypothetical protein
VFPAVQIELKPLEGLAPLSSTLVVYNTTSSDVAVSINGAPAGTVGAEQSLSLPVGLSAAGALSLSVSASNAQGVVATKDFVLVATDAANLDQMLRGLWSIFTEALAARDAARALALFTPEGAAKYGPVFEALTAELPGIVESFSPLALSRLSSEAAEYIVVRPFGGTTRLYFVYFVRGIDGVWRLDEM